MSLAPGSCKLIIILIIVFKALYVFVLHVWK